jgi:dihydrofolate synthase/folylpolyglutamate synthase
VRSSEVDSDTRIREIRRAYPVRTARSDLDGLDRFVVLTGIALPPRKNLAVVVGTNGKTSTATFLARAAMLAGRRVGLTTSPHIERWGERVQVDGIPVDDRRLATEIERLHALALRVAYRDDLRFFDLLTLAAARIFVEEQVDVAVFEAGIGGRLDSTRILRSRLVLLTSIGLDHTDMLGGSEEKILREKLGAAARGTTVLSGPLAEPLRSSARALARNAGVTLRFVDSASGDFLRRNAELARAAAVQLVGPGVRLDASTLLAGGVPGRYERRHVDGVDVIVDAAHNPQAWSALAPLLPSSFLAVVSVSLDRPAERVREPLSRARHVIVTEAWPGHSYPAPVLAAQLGAAEVVPDPVAAVTRGLELARDWDEPLVVFGSTYLLPHAYVALRAAEVYGSA